jgi:3-dehydroquinate dehydratase/shikimate dehydrogenase
VVARERGELAVKLLGLPFVPLADFHATRFPLLVNATPIGREGDSLPFAVDTLSSGTVVVDLVYGAQPTPLVAAALGRGGAVIDGYDVLLNQVRKQFQMMTGLQMPAHIGWQALSYHPPGKPGYPAGLQNENPLLRARERAAMPPVNQPSISMKIAKA